jgi:ankyrin repeat protein
MSTRYKGKDGVIENLFQARGYDYAMLASSLAAKYRGPDALTELLVKPRDEQVYQLFYGNKVSVAAYSGDKVVLESLLALEEADINVYDEYLGTAIYAAMCSGSDFVELLLKRGADPNRIIGERGTPLIVAVRERNEKVVQLLVQHPGLLVNESDMNNKTALWWSVSLGYIEITRLLARHKDATVACTAAKDDKCVLWRAVYHGRAQLMEALLNDSSTRPDDCRHSGETLLWWAVRYGHASIVQLLLECTDVDPNVQGSNGAAPFWLAVINGRVDIVRSFLKRQDLQPNLLSHGGSTPLLAAVNGNHEAIVSLLLECEAVDPDLKGERNQSPLSRAAQFGRTRILELLLTQNGINVNSVAVNGLTPLGFACLKGHEAVVRLLLGQKDTVLDTKDKWDYTPLRHAASSGYADIVRLLLDSRTIAENEEDGELDLCLTDVTHYNHVAVVEVLLEHNVNIHVKDKMNQTLLDMARKHGEKEIEKPLRHRIQFNPLENIDKGC